LDVATAVMQKAKHRGSSVSALVALVALVAIKRDSLPPGSPCVCVCVCVCVCMCVYVCGLASVVFQPIKRHASRENLVTALVSMLIASPTCSVTYTGLKAHARTHTHTHIHTHTHTHTARKCTRTYSHANLHTNIPGSPGCARQTPPPATAAWSCLSTFVSCSSSSLSRFANKRAQRPRTNPHATLFCRGFSCLSLLTGYPTGRC